MDRAAGGTLGQIAGTVAMPSEGHVAKPVENQLPDLMEVYRKAREYYDSGQDTP